jgi:hypothetical protein
MFNRKTKYNNLTFYFDGGASYTIDKVEKWEIRHAGAAVNYLSVTQSKTAKARLVIGSVNLSKIVSIVET